MNIARGGDYWGAVLREHLALGRECTWVEFKHNQSDPQEIGEYASALSNAAALAGQPRGYLWWGIENACLTVVGTTVDPWTIKKGNGDLIPWLQSQMDPKVHVGFETLTVDGSTVVVMIVNRALVYPTKFGGHDYIRVDSHKKPLRRAPEMAAELWKILDSTPFEYQVAAERVDTPQVLELLDFDAYFRLSKRPIPDGHSKILAALVDEELVAAQPDGSWSINNLGALLLARDLAAFRHLRRKAFRVVEYAGVDRLETKREQPGRLGYAVGFDGLLRYLMALLPANEVLESAFRRDVPLFPARALRELVANALIHQDLTSTGEGPMIELFSDRIEITNPGRPLVATDRFIDGRKSRNEALAEQMRLMHICEERGSGMEKVFADIEMFQLPPALIETAETPSPTTKVVLFAPRTFDAMDKAERVRACFQHTCLRWVQHQRASNESVRERFGISEKNRAMASRILSDTVGARLIRLYDETVGTKARSYVPYWA